MKKFARPFGWAVIAAVWIAGAAVPCAAQDELETSTVPAAGGLPETPASKTIEQDPVKAVADRFAVAPSVVEELRRGGNDWTETVLILAVAQTAGRPAEEIRDQRKSGQDWEEIARRLNVDLRAVNEEAQAVLMDLQARGSDVQLLPSTVTLPPPLPASPTVPYTIEQPAGDPGPAAP